MESSRRIALPLAIALHILLLFLLSRQSVFMRPIENAGRSLTVQLIPFLQPKAPTLPAPTVSHPDSASPERPKNPSLSSAAKPPVPITESPAPITEPSKEGLSDSKPTAMDPAALVRSYSYEDSKSDLQKAIESHGGTVALTKGKYDDFHAQVEEATTPDCMKADALKHDPPKIGPVGLSGPLVLLFLAHAVATGKCQLPGAH